MVESSLPGSFAIIVCPLVTRITSRVADNHPYSFYLQAGIISRIHPLPLRWNGKSDWYSRVWSDKLILFESWVDENQNECPFVFSFRISIALTGDPFVNLSIFHPRWHLVGSRQKSGRYTEFPGTRIRAYTHMDIHIHIRFACTRLHTPKERFEYLRGAGIHPLSFYYPLSSSFCSMCEPREIYWKRRPTFASSKVTS